MFIFSTRNAHTRFVCTHALNFTRARCVRQFDLMFQYAFVAARMGFTTTNATDAGSLWDPNTNASTNAGSLWDPNINATDAGSLWDPNTNATDAGSLWDPNTNASTDA
jgi:hypothetical protein